ncbi:hypothetical protein PLICRDRAFT_693535 [Plicaturopsis crispa FD-325 SS-3]|nr:hypothetical protein PLICRDRAFT_693535 [Plicaturopsis crispa FD-325 SS-3]
MLSNDVQETPRPRPPAKVRRASSNSALKASPPPPYARAAFPTIHSIPDSDDDTNGPSDNALLASPIQLSADAPGEKSRSELADLLLKADGLIKERENELGLTTAVCKSLFETNLSLKSQHEALLARIPRSPLHSPAMSTTSLDQSVSSPPPSAALSLPPGARTRHTRRISINPADISLLSDQNAELMSKLERLESDSIHADQAGRRRLRKLEKELQTLREELESTRARSEQLEERTSALALAEESTAKRREEHEERVRALRSKSSITDDEENEEVRDFAPGNPLDLTAMPLHRRASHPALFTLPTTPAPKVNLSTKPSMEFAASQSLPSVPASSQEPALISRLLHKIQELEEANAQIGLQQTTTAARVRAVQHDAHCMREMYATLGDGETVEFELVLDDSQLQPTSGEPGAVKFRSLRRAIGTGQGDVFGEGGGKGSIPSMQKGGGMHKTRKSVVGLFDSPHSNAPKAPGSQNASYFATQPVPFPAHEIDLNISQPTSPTLSTLSIPPTHTLLDSLSPLDGEGRHSLQSELGSAFGDEFAPNHHLRTSSLYGISAACTPAPSGPSILPPETPTPVNHIPLSDDSLAARAKQSLRYRRMSQTVRSRTNQWVNGRFRESLLGPKRSTKDEDEPSRSRPDPPMPSRLATALDVVVEKLTGASQGSSSTASGTVSKENVVRLDEDADADVADKPHEDRTVLSQSQDKGVGAVVLELWLWLQFAIIILVFLWAMAKRGPKSVLDEAERRRTSAARA